MGAAGRLRAWVGKAGSIWGRFPGRVEREWYRATTVTGKPVIVSCLNDSATEGGSDGRNMAHSVSVGHAGVTGVFSRFSFEDQRWPSAS